MFVSPKDFISAQAGEHDFYASGVGCLGDEIGVDTIVGRLVHGRENRPDLTPEISHRHKDFLVLRLKMRGDVASRRSLAIFLLFKSYCQSDEWRSHASAGQSRKRDGVNTAAEKN